MSAKIIVIVEDEDFRFGSGKFAEKIRRGQAADAASHDDQVIRFAVGDSSGPFLAVAEGVSYFPGAVMAAAQASLRRWIVVGVLFRFEYRLGHTERFQPGGTCRNQGRPHGDAYTIDKVAARNRAPHAQFTISFVVVHVSSR